MVLYAPNAKAERPLLSAVRSNNLFGGTARRSLARAPLGRFPHLRKRTRQNVGFRDEA